MRVISGEARGRRLSTLEGEHTRPTSEKVKEAVFSIIQFELEGRRVLDLFAGSGQMGIEAISRGARECVFVENDRAAAKIVRENVEKCKFQGRARFVVSDFKSFLSRGGEPFDIIIADPPYAAGYYKKILESISEFDMLNFNGIIIVESPRELQLDKPPEGITKGREYLYGKTKITVYRRD